MTSSHLPEQAQPWWADVAHLQDRQSGSRRDAAPSAERPATPTHARERHHRPRTQEPRRRSNGQRRSPRATPRPDWFTQDSVSDGRVQRPAPPASDRPRARLVDVSPDHAILSRPMAVRRAPGERPTVTITGRPEAATPFRATEPKRMSHRRTRETFSAMTSSPDRLILWAVALGILMIVASLLTAQTGA